MAPVQPALQQTSQDLRRLSLERRGQLSRPSSEASQVCNKLAAGSAFCLGSFQRAALLTWQHAPSVQLPLLAALPICSPR